MNHRAIARRAAAWLLLLSLQTGMAEGFAANIAATVILGDLTQTYAGKTLSASCSTDPAGLSVAITYSDMGKGTNPQHAGYYGVTCTVTEPGYEGSVTGVLTIEQSKLIIFISMPSLSVPGGGWYLFGNTTDTTWNVGAMLADASKVSSVWKWLPSSGKWAFYSPSLTSLELADYAAAKGYEVLASINPGDGFWVNSLQAFSVMLPLSGKAYSGTGVISPEPLMSGWNLIAISSVWTPSQFNAHLAPSSEGFPQAFKTLWAWDNSRATWYFYAPTLEAQGGRVLSDYATSKGYLDFADEGKVLGSQTGIWVDMP